MSKYETTSLMERPNITKSESTKYAKIVWVRVEFLAIGEVDTMNEKYQAEVRIKSKWYDDDGDNPEYDKTKDWYPKLFIENALHDLKEEFDYKVTKVDDKRMITETRIAKGSFWERIELQNFPIDIQELSVTLASKLKPSKVKLVSDPIKISTIHNEALHTFRDQQKWKLYKIVQVSEQASYDFESVKSLKISNDSTDFHQINLDNRNRKSKFVATCYCSRRPAYYLINCYSFNFLITILSLTIFSIETRLAPNRISGTFTLILTSVSFKWVSNRTIPTVSYLTSLDKYQIISIIYLVMCCVWHSTIASIDMDMSKKIVIDKLVLCIFATVFLVIQIVFTIGIVIAFEDLKAIKKRELKFLAQNPNQSDSDDEDD